MLWWWYVCYIILTSQWPRWRLKSPASRLFTQPFIQTQIKENFKAPRHWTLCGEVTGTGEFPAQRVSYAENVSIWWRDHDVFASCKKSCTIQSYRFGVIIILWNSFSPIQLPNYIDRQNYSADVFNETLFIILCIITSTLTCILFFQILLRATSEYPSFYVISCQLNYLSTINADVYIKQSTRTLMHCAFPLSHHRTMTLAI